MTRSLRAPVALVALLAFAAPAFAQEEAGGRLELRTRTLLMGQERAPGVFLEWPVIQWLELTGHDLGTPGLSAHTSLWGLGDFAGGDDLVTGDSIAGDVNLFYAQYRDPRGHYAARLGRQIVYTGPGVGFLGHIDGGWARGAVHGFEAEIYGGRIVAPRFGNISQYDWMAGARAGYRSWGNYAVGLSYVHARNDGAIAREAVGVDANLGIVEGLDASGYLSYDLLSEGLIESALLARWRPTSRITAGVQVRQASPGRMLDQTSIFSVFTLADYAEFGGLVEWVWSDQWVLGADYSRVFFPDADGTGLGEQANRFAARITGTPIRQLWIRVRGERLPSPTNGYTALRIAGRYMPNQPWSVNLDLLGYFYDDPALRGGDSESLIARGFLEYELQKGLMLGIGGDIGETVLSEFEARALLRLTWAAEMQLGGGE